MRVWNLDSCCCEEGVEKEGRGTGTICRKYRTVMVKRIGNIRGRNKTIGKNLEGQKRVKVMDECQMKITRDKML